MSVNAISGHELGRRLIEAGVVPLDEVVEITLTTGFDEPVRLHIVQNATSEQLAKIAKVMAAIAEESW